MPDIEARNTLQTLLDKCVECRSIYNDNVVLLIAEDEGTLTDAQIIAVLDELRTRHRGHKHEIVH